MALRVVVLWCCGVAGTVIHVGDSNPVEVGQSCVIGHRAVLHACTLGDRVLVGMNATVPC